MNNEPVVQKAVSTQPQLEGTVLAGIQKNGLRTPTRNTDRATDPYFTIEQLNNMYSDRFQYNQIG
jgi:hypothetical protein